MFNIQPILNSFKWIKSNTFWNINSYSLIEQYVTRKIWWFFPSDLSFLDINSKWCKKYVVHYYIFEGWPLKLRNLVSTHFEKTQTESLTNCHVCVFDMNSFKLHTKVHTSMLYLVKTYRNKKLSITVQYMNISKIVRLTKLLAGK